MRFVPRSRNSSVRTGHLRFDGNQAGAILVEVVVSASILATGIIAGLSAISTTSIATRIATEDSTASWIATSQADLIKSLPYVPTGGSYATVDVPTGFTVQNTTSAFPGGNAFIQNVTITVSSGGSEVFSLVMVKVDR